MKQGIYQSRDHFGTIYSSKDATFTKQAELTLVNLCSYWFALKFGCRFHQSQSVVLLRTAPSKYSLSFIGKSHSSWLVANDFVFAFVVLLFDFVRFKGVDMFNCSVKCLNVYIVVFINNVTSTLCRVMLVLIIWLLNSRKACHCWIYTRMDVTIRHTDF